MRNRFPREFYIPKGARAFRDRESSAVAYVYDNGHGQPCAVAFHGKADKPDWRYRFRSPAERESEVRRHFAGWRAREGAKQEEAAKRKAWVNPYKPGDIFRRSWGYDQTNVDYYQVIAVRGKRVQIQQIAAGYEATGDMCGKCVPLPGQFKGEPEWRLAQDGRIKINHYAHAYYFAPTMVAGVPTYGADYTSSYA